MCVFVVVDLVQKVCKYKNICLLCVRVWLFALVSTVKC